MRAILQDDCLVRNNVTISGTENAERTVVFVHGLGTEQSAWQHVSASLGSAFRKIAFDHVGATEENRASFLAHQTRYLGLSGYVDDLLDVCDRLALDKPAVFIGHSLGATVCLLASLRRPALFEKLVLIGASPCYMNLDDYQGGLERSDIDSIYQAIHQDYLGWASAFAASAMDNPDQPQLARLFAATLASIPSDMMLTVLCSILQQDHRKDIRHVTRPTLIIQSRRDPFVPPFVANYLHTHIPDSRLAVIEAVGHLPHVSAPGEVTKAILDFIDSTTRSAGPEAVAT